MPSSRLAAWWQRGHVQVVSAALLLLLLLVWRGTSSDTVPSPARGGLGRKARLFVEKTSVHAKGGLGVYAGQRIPRGKVATAYPGPVLTQSQHDRLFAALTSNAEHAQRGEKPLFGPIVMRLLHRFVVSGDKVDWPLVLKVAQSYRFGFPVNQPGEEEEFRYLIWMAFDGSSGRPIVDVHNATTVGLLINEPPPPREFYNHVWGRPQRSEANVQARNTDRGVDLVALRDIEPGEELLYCYGPFYFLRDYPIREEACPRNLWKS